MNKMKLAYNNGKEANDSTNDNEENDSKAKKSKKKQQNDGAIDKFVTKKQKI
jgi:hypothetical protein